ncbi:nucleoid-associated protein [Mesorhizobium sp.]|uniref:nucleoid-associated protein n=1 Tax=Mesorhizobium sp. TaxID=1871066 RepID=UPI000FE95D16|nr:nucleoid-associated protein [Mesorhizobium sp.]RWD31163.1 MAG: hypothetical protein EOS33_14685 [Mesorhizobium sp.]
MPFENLTIQRAVMHEVYRRLDDRQIVPPTYGQQLLALNQEARDDIRDRVVSAVGSHSQSMLMQIKPVTPGCAVEIARDLMSLPDAAFVTQSRRFADRLAEAQLRRDLPGGVLVVFEGNAGNPQRPYIGVVKAEKHSGFRQGAAMTVQYFRDLFLTPQAKLYKIGMFVRMDAHAVGGLPAGWEATVYDSQMTSSNREGAAQYFYEGFLGCTLPQNSARLTKRFFDETREFIKNQNIPEEQKIDLYSSLYTYLKVDQGQTIQTAAFANQYLDAGLSDSYADFMAQREFPDNAVAKDLSDVQNQLRRRKVGFSRSIQLTAPPDAFDELVTVHEIAGEPNQPGGPAPIWTQITIRDRIREQE